MRVLISGERAADRDMARRSALRIGLDCGAADCVPLVDLGLRLSRAPAIHLIIVCVDPEPAAAVQAIQLTAGQFEQPIFAVTEGDAKAIEVQVVPAGAKAVWPFNDLKEGLLRSYDELQMQGTPANRRGRVIAVTAALPGSGVTTVATGLAFACAGSASVVLAELGVAVPELALDLDLAPRHSLAELIGASERMDASMIRNTVVAHAAGVDVLAYLPDTPTAEPLPAAAIRDFQILLRNLYNWTILDAGHPRAGSNDDLIRHADHIVLVARLDPPSLRLTRKYFQSLVTGGVPADQIAVVANRYGQPGLVPWRKAEEALSTTIRAWLPDDPKSVNRCLVEGQPLVQIAKRSPLAVEFSKLAAELVAKSVVS